MVSARVISAKNNASQRTKNRVKENGPTFHLSRELPEVHINGGKVRARLVHSERTDWVGWLPTDEIEIDK